LVRHYRSYIEHEHRAGSRVKTLHRLTATFADFADKRLTDLDALSIERWRRERLRGGIAVSTIERDLAALRSVLAHAVRHGFIEISPMATIKPRKFDNARCRFLSDAEERSLRDALDLRDQGMRDARESANRWRVARNKDTMPAIEADTYPDHVTPLVLTALNTGLRRGELSSLLWTDIDLDRRSLTVRAAAAKGGKRRDVPLNSEAVAVLARWRDQSDGPRVFGVADAKKAFSGVLQEAGIDGFTFHDLRHTFASKLVMGGTDLNTVRELLGHADLKMTLRYAHLAKGHKAEAVERLVASS
ncbi:MAG: site-specific integrase, partial [Xanthomonadales bacterium]|nr:site-specific integrase [Xanthomonadales bacterium]